MEIFGQSYNAEFRTSAGSGSLSELSKSFRRIEGSNSSHRSLLQQDVSKSVYDSDHAFESSSIDQDVHPIAESRKPLEGAFSQHDSQIYSNTGTLLSDDKKYPDNLIENAHETTTLVVAENGVAVEIKKNGHLLQRIPDGKGYGTLAIQDRSFVSDNAVFEVVLETSLKGNFPNKSSAGSTTDFFFLGLEGATPVQASKASASNAYLGQGLSIFA